MLFSSDVDLVVVALHRSRDLTLSAASASAGITILIHDDLEYCYDNPCPSYEAATAMTFLSWFALAPCCVLNLGTAIYKLQRP